ncbi:MAG: HAD-IIIA family hydrolase [Firmicutes bacterium]|nr:HAD-IIIA family hydrolase [Bacillota bacterium]
MDNNLGLQPAVFLDRDGVITREIGYITQCAQVELYPFAAKAIASLNNNGWLCILLTNQSAVARGMLTEQQLAKIHGHLEELLRAESAYLDAIYYCPHLPPEEGEKEIPPYRVKCTCRKPGMGMINKAFEQFGIDAAQSYVIGDRETDIVMGENAGLSTILLRTGYGVQRYKGESGIEPDFTFDDLAEAAKFLVGSRTDYKSLIEVVVTRYLELGKKRLIVLVGGQSRSGKSTVVKYLSKEMGKKSIPAAVIRLDDWILPLNKRQGARTVLDRYPASDIERDLAALLAGDVLYIGAYDPKSRGVARKKKEISLPLKGVIFIEGVVALAMEFLRSISDLNVFVDVDRKTHRKRFLRYYIDKGLEEESVYSLYKERMRDEYPFVEESIKHADTIVRPKR